MMTCSHCRGANPDGTSYCGHCGQPLIAGLHTYADSGRSNAPPNPSGRTMLGLAPETGALVLASAVVVFAFPLLWLGIRYQQNAPNRPSRTEIATKRLVDVPAKPNSPPQRSIGSAPVPVPRREAPTARPASPEKAGAPPSKAKVAEPVKRPMVLETPRTKSTAPPPAGHVPPSREVEDIAARTSEPTLAAGVVSKPPAMPPARQELLPRDPAPPRRLELTPPAATQDLPQPAPPPSSTPQRIDPPASGVPPPIDPPASAPRRIAPGTTGLILWSGVLEKLGEITIVAGRASSGDIRSGSLPGVPVAVTVQPTDVGVAEFPSPANGWNRIVLRSRSKRHSVVQIFWTAK